MDNLIYMYILTGLGITWVRPIYCSFRQNAVKPWIEYWVLLSIATYIEINVFPEYSKDLAYNFLRTMTLFVMSERAVVAATPKLKKKTEEKDDPNDFPCENFAEKIVHLDRFDDKTSVGILEKLLECQDKSMIDFENKIDWVAPPQSVRSCTAYKLAILISTNKYSEDKLKDFPSSRIPKLLMAMLQDPDQGERDSAILAICYIVDRNKKLRKVFFELHIFEVLHKILQIGTRPFCIRTVVAILRRIFLERDQAKEEFLRSKMTLDLIKLLESEVLELVAETAEAIKDLVMKSQTILNKAYLGILANQGLDAYVQIALKNHGSNNKLKISLRTIDTLIKSI